MILRGGFFMSKVWIVFSFVGQSTAKAAMDAAAVEDLKLWAVGLAL